VNIDVYVDGLIRQLPGPVATTRLRVAGASGNWNGGPGPSDSIPLGMMVVEAR
jgi:hypothetical protein